MKALNLKSLQYLFKPYSIRLKRTRYRKYRFNPKSTMRKKTFSTFSKMKLMFFSLSLAVVTCAAGHKYKTTKQTAVMAAARPHFKCFALR